MFDVSGGDVIGEFGDLIVSFFDRVKNLRAQLQLLGILLAVQLAVAIEQTDARVQIPAVIIERRFVRQRTVERLDVFERHLFDVNEPDDHVGDLHAGVVDVVLHLYPITDGLKDAHKRIAEH